MAIKFRVPSLASESDHYLPNNYSCERSLPSTGIFRANDKSTIVAVHHSRAIKYVARGKSFAEEYSAIRTPFPFCLPAGAPGSSSFFLSAAPFRFPVCMDAQSSAIAIRSRDGHFIRVEFEGAQTHANTPRKRACNGHTYANRWR